MYLIYIYHAVFISDEGTLFLRLCHFITNKVTLIISCMVLDMAHLFDINAWQHSWWNIICHNNIRKLSWKFYCYDAQMFIIGQQRICETNCPLHIISLGHVWFTTLKGAHINNFPGGAGDLVGGSLNFVVCQRGGGALNFIVCQRGGGHSILMHMKGGVTQFHAISCGILRTFVAKLRFFFGRYARN